MYVTVHIVHVSHLTCQKQCQYCQVQIIEARPPQKHVSWLLQTNRVQELY